MNLIQNGSFDDGLAGWEATPAGVTFVRTEAKRFVMLGSERQTAAICSDPLDVTPGAAYFLEVERALRGDCEIAMIGRDSLLSPGPTDEVVAVETPVRVQVTAKKSHKVGIARVVLTPVGPRARILNVRSTVAFRKRGEPFEILCEVLNTGSETIIGAVARLQTSSHDVAEDHRAELRLPALKLGQSESLGWGVHGQRRALAPFSIEVEYGQSTITAHGTTLRHVPAPPEVRTAQSVAGGRRWFTVASRGLRVTAHDTDLDFGPLLVTEESSKRPLGVIHQMAQILTETGGGIPLWSAIRKLGPGGIELAGKNDMAEWTIHVKPDHRRRGISFDLRINGLRRVPNANIEIAPFQTTLPFHLEGTEVVFSSEKEKLRLAWAWKAPETFEVAASEVSGLIILRSKPVTLMPGMLFQASAILHRGGTSIIRAE